jgi:hypothetical protein
MITVQHYASTKNGAYREFNSQEKADTNCTINDVPLWVDTNTTTSILKYIHTHTHTHTLTHTENAIVDCDRLVDYFNFILYSQNKWHITLLGLE